jgi:hypothetical protein
MIIMGKLVPAPAPTFSELARRASYASKANKLHHDLVEDIRKLVVEANPEPLRARMEKMDILPAESQAIIEKIRTEREHIVSDMNEAGRIENDPLYDTIREGDPKQKLLAIAALQSLLPAYTSDADFVSYSESPLRVLYKTPPVLFAAIASIQSLIMGIYSGSAGFGIAGVASSILFSSWMAYRQFKDALKTRAEYRKYSLPDDFSREIISLMVDAKTGTNQIEEQRFRLLPEPDSPGIQKIPAHFQAKKP